MTAPEPEMSAAEMDGPTAAEWLEPGLEDLHPDGFEPRVPPDLAAELTAPDLGLEPEPEL